MSFKMSLLTFEDLPSEVQLKVFRFLKKDDLIRCGQVSKRMRAISHDKSLWPKINLSRKRVPSGFLQLIVNNGCKYLTLCDAKLEGTLNFPKPSQLTNLDLKYCKANNEVLEQLLMSCHSLEKISLAHLPTNSKMLRNICLQNGHSLQVLVLAECKGLDLESIEHIVNNCFDLKEINLDITYLAQDAIIFLVNKLEPKITNLSLAWLEAITDEHVKALISRCTNLKALDLRGTPITNNSVSKIIEYLMNSLEELSISYTNINFDKLLELNSMLKLRSLNCLHLENAEVENLENKAF